MQYIVCAEPGRFEVGEKEEPKRDEGHTLIKIKRVGICGTDIHAFGGNQPFFNYPRILGHELSGEVIEIDPQQASFRINEKVIISPYTYCGKCIACRKGKTNCCTQLKLLGIHVDGGMQEIISVPTQQLMSADSLSLDEMAIVEPLAIGAHAIRRAGMQAGETAVVIGCGPIGIGILFQAHLSGIRTVAIDLSAERLALVKALGIPITIPAGPNAVSELREQVGDLSEYVFDATGNTRALEQGVDYMAHGGTYVLVGLSKDPLSFHHPSIHAKEASILCSRNATAEDFGQVVSMLSSGKFPTESYISHRTLASDLIEVFPKWIDPTTGVIKGMVQW